MRASTATPPVHKGKRRLLESCAIAAGLMALMQGGPALAQVAGTGQVVSGSGSISPPDPLGPTAPPNSTQVEVSTPQTIINWTPTDDAPTGGTIDFLPAGNTLEFYGTGDYTVLNRFVDAAGGSIGRQVALNGTVNSYVGSRFASSGNVPGGNIWFYNAGGVLIGNGAAINVGSLLLTANDIDTTGGLFGAGGEIRFRGAAGTSRVEVANGASINAAVAGNPGGSYVALVAPRIVQSGAVRVDGSAAYVAAEQADIRINGGLFDIDVLVGADGGNAIVHDGSTTGPTHEQGDVDQSRIYMVAIPKNDAVTMLVSGEVGYDDAVVAQTDPDGAIVLSAGYGVTAGQIDASPANGTAANIAVSDTIFRSSVRTHASGAFTGAPANPVPPSPIPGAPAEGMLMTEGNATFIGDASATLTVSAGQQAGATGNLSLQSGGAASIDVAGGQLTTGGTLDLASTGQVQADGSSVGGDVTLSIIDGTVQAASVTLTSTGNAGVGGTGQAGNGTGGAASLLVSGTDASLTADDIAVQSVGRGGGLTSSSGFVVSAADTGGDGTGGSATLRIENGASLAASTVISVGSTGYGQTGNIQSGTGTGGTALLSVSGSGSTLTAAFTSVSADGFGGEDYLQSPAPDFLTLNGGDGIGGTASVSFTGDAPTDTNLGKATVSASGFGGGASAGENAVGGDAQGGSVAMTIDGALTIEAAELDLIATANSGSAASPSLTTALSGDAQGGSVAFTATGGALFSTSTDIILSADGAVGSGESFGSGAGGDIAVTATGGGTIGGQGLSASASGGSDALDAARGSSSGTGGHIGFTADGGTISSIAYNLYAEGRTPDADVGGVAQGGTIDLLASNGGLIEASDPASFSDFSANAQSGQSIDGAAATGGAIRFIADAGTISLPGSASVSVNGISGGASPSSGAVPLGRGGTLVLRTVAEASDSSALLFGSLSGYADGSAGFGSEGSPGSGIPVGNGLGGDISVDVQGGSFTVTGLLSLGATGYGGGVGSNGGTGTGGTVGFTQTGGATIGGDIGISADGYGGYDPNGAGDGFGGTATMDLLAGTLNAAEVSASARGYGGYGFEGDDFDPANIIPPASGGDGAGGVATITLAGTIAETSSLAAVATGNGGDGAGFYVYNGTPAVAGDGGDGAGGLATVNMIAGTLITTSLTVDSRGIGGTGGSVLDSSSPGAIASIGIGGTGGNGGGGISTLALATGVEPGAAVTVVSQGTGGGGGSAGTGGDAGSGSGGTAQIVVTDYDADLLQATVDASATGGAGGYGDDGAGGDGGAGGGGTARVQADGPNARVTVSQANFVASGTGGAGGAAHGYATSGFATGPSGGDGGAGTGGTLEVVATNGGALSVGPIPDTTGTIALSVGGTGGTGGAGADNDFGAGLSGGDGGDGGIGAGGTVHLLADGGTVATTGEPVDIAVSGVAGAGGTGGAGTAGAGAAGASGTTAGGRAVIEARTTTVPTAAINLGDTSIGANGDAAGRIEFLGDGAITMASLTAEALGSAAPTNNDTDTAASGIFFGVYGGTVQTAGNATLTTDGSIGVHGQGGGIVAIGGDLSLQAGDQIDIRHDFRAGTAPTIQAGGNLIATAGTGISSAAGSLLAANGTLSLTATTGVIGVDQLHGADIILNSAGATRVEHAEADTDFTTQAASFATGPNSIITGGNIDINVPGAVDLGNSSAGGYVFVVGQSISFNAIDAGTTIGLNANGAGAADGIDGGDLTAAGNIVLSGNHVAVGGTITTPATLAINAGNGSAAASLADVGGSISVVAAGDIDGIFRAGGNVVLTAGGNIAAEADAAGGYVDPNGIPAEGYVFADADGDAFLTGSSAATMLAVRAGGAAGIDGAAAGEDIFLLAGTTATLANLTAGDDIDATAGGAMTIADAMTTGSGNDTRSVVYAPGASVPTPFLQIQASPAGLSNITLSAPTATIAAADLSAFDNLTATAGGAVAGTGLLQSGLATSISGSALSFAAISAGTDLDLTATTGGITSTGVFAAGYDATLDAAGGIDLFEVDAGDDAMLTAAGPVAAGAAYSGTGSFDDEGDGGNIAIAGGATTVGHAEAADDFTADVASFITGTNTIIAGGDIDIRSAGAADLGNSSAGGYIAVDARSIAFAALDAGTTVDLTAANAIAGGSIAAGGGIALAGGSIAVGSIVGDAVLSATATAGSVTVNQADLAGSVAVDASGDIAGSYAAGGDIAFSAGGAIDVASIAKQGAGSVTLNGAGGIAADTIVNQGATGLTSANGAIAVASLASAGAVDADGRSVAIGGSGDLVFTSLVATAGDATVGTAGTLSVASATVAGLADFGGDQGLTVGTLDAGEARLAAANGDILLTGASVASGLSADAGGAIAIDGTVTGATIVLASRDIAIGAAGQVGAAGTTASLSIANSGTQQTFVGGDGSGDGYNIDADEMARLYGSGIRIFAPVAAGAAGGPDLVVGDFTMTGGSDTSNLGPAGSLILETAGRAEVAGAVALTGLSSANQLSIIAASTLDIVLGEGSIRLTGANDSAPGGRLSLAADRIAVATRTAIADVDAATSTDAIEVRLAQNDGVASDEGALFARGIDVGAVSGFYVQNSGTGVDFDQRRGLTFGDGGFNVDTAGSATRLVLNGVYLGPQGQVVGLDAIPLLTVNGSAATFGSFEARSRFNGCLIAAPVLCGRGFDSIPIFPVQDVIEEEVGTDGKPDEGITLPTALIMIRDIDPPTGAPLLDDPVTGAGNDDLWTPPAKDDGNE
ncbi:beta strand repeat-containing protein [Sphingopyxis indica]|uniref:Filamentous hemagglutinin family N-terminal domain-containing protein n=1 Tax=Sphingopyxis indica TaxID=436663 RepID=A0A239FNB5_9SPHN|nr:hypothetical protein [Sphingopyxis indica]SNS57732.1 hypothetical protein SAMN06295955_102142 [Sphingopyxis indica]